MRLGFYIGWLLLGLGFVAAAAEVAAQAQSASFGYLSAFDVLHTILPHELAIAKIRFERWFGELAWDIVAFTVLSLPGWALFGVPGVIVVWHCRPQHVMDIDEQDDAHYSSFEDIVAAAEEADETAEDESELPSKYRNLGEYDPTAAGEEDAMTEIVQNWDPDETFPDPAADQPGFLPPTGRNPKDEDGPT